MLCLFSRVDASWMDAPAVIQAEYGQKVSAMAR